MKKENQANDKKLGFTDYLQIVNSFVILILGIVIFYRAFIHKANIILFLMGICFFFFGLYRLKFIFTHFSKRNILL